MATGSKGGLKYDFLKPIKDFKIIAFPDKSEYNEWLKKSIEFNAVGFKIVVSDWLEQQPNFEDGTDFADVYINETKNIEPQQIIKDLSIYSNTEQAIYRMEQHTPEIRILIDTFDLTDYYGNEIRKIV